MARFEGSRERTSSSRGRGDSRDRRSSRGSGRSDNRSFEEFSKSRGGSGRFDGRRAKPEMHEVVCDKCGKDCEVPFKPSSSKPVYCSDCFEKSERSGSSRGSISEGDLDIINEKLNKIMKALNIE